MVEEGSYNIGNRLIDYDEENYEEGLIYYQSVIDLLAQGEIDIDQFKIAKFINEYNFQIPEYQRDYEWEQPQWEDLWLQVDKLFDANLATGTEKTPDVFFGSMFFAERGTTADGNSDVVEVIDGQQRLTTLSILFKVISDLLGTLEPESSETTAIADGLETKIKNILYLESSIPGRTRPSLTLNEHNRDFYDALVSGPSAQLEFINSQRGVHGNRKKHAIRVHTFAKALNIDPEVYKEYENENKHFDRANDRILRAYQYFLGELSEKLGEAFETDDQKVKALTNITNYILNSFIVGYFEITSNRSSLMMSVFQILNDRGMNLKKVDIIRARIVSCLREGDDESAAEDISKYEAMIENLNNDYSDVEDFLIDYLAAYEDDINSKSDVTKNLLEAFEQTSSRNEVMDPRLTSKEATREFLDHINDYSIYYHQIIDPDERLEMADEDREDRANEIIARLNKLGYEQWRPLILLVYGELRSSVTADREEFFIRLLKVVENISFRVSLTNVYPSIQDAVYINACQEFRTGQFSDSLFKTVVDGIEKKANQLFGESFFDAVIEEYNWNNTVARALLWKVTSEKFYESESAVLSRLDVDNIHLEHILPQSPLRNGDERYNWINYFFKTEGDGDEVTEIIQNMIEDDSIEDRDEHLTDISKYFADDIANMVLLESEENLSVGNSLFSTKVLKYYDTKDFDAIPVNEFFTSESGKITDEEIEELRAGTLYLDNFWNYDTLTERKVDLLPVVFDSIAFDGVRDDEFESYDIEEKVKDETDRRLGLIEANYRNIVD